MDKLFEYGLEDMMKHLADVGMEVQAEKYKEKDAMDVFFMTYSAEKYIRKIYNHMQESYPEDEQTVLNMLKELYDMVVMEVWLNDRDVEKCVNKTILNMKRERAKDGITYAAQVLGRHFLLYERSTHTRAEWMELVRMVHEISEMFTQLEKEEKTMGLKYTADQFITELRKHMDQYVIGQETLKKKICVLLNGWLYNENRTNLLIIGPSGSGKNHMVNTISTFEGLGRVVMSYDCSSLTPNGFTGADVREIFKRLNTVCSRAGKSVEGSIVYLDEIDKIINYNHDANGESVNAMVQQQLLSCLAGTETIENVDTSKILFILGGAFPRIDDLKKQSKRVIGFNTAEEENVDFHTTLREQICEIGGEREFVGRIGEIVKLAKPKREELKEILLDEELGVYTAKKKMFEEAGFTLEIEEDTVEAILDLIEKEDLGARSVTNIMNEIVDSQYFYDMMVEGYEKMIIHKGMLSGEPPVLKKRKAKKPVQSV